MPGGGPAPADRVGVELFMVTGAEEEPAEDDEYIPARGADQTSGRWRARVIRIGQDAVDSAARLVGQQVGAMVRETLAGMDQADLAGTTAAGLRASSVQLSFGVKLTAGAGKAIEAVMTAGGEASVQVVVILDCPS